jgi:gas vesicle protein
MGEKDHSRFLDGLIVGGLLGMIFGLLYAPKKGEETRGVVKEKINKLKDSFENARASTEEIVEKTKKSIEDGLEEIASTIEKRKKKQTTEDMETF